MPNSKSNAKPRFGASGQKQGSASKMKPQHGTQGQGSGSKNNGGKPRMGATGQPLAGK